MNIELWRKTFAPDIVKVDAEGTTYEVLKGFGEFIDEVKAFHLECEHYEVWNGQKTYSEVEQIMIESGFVLTSIKAAWPQTDSVWIRKDCWKPDWWK